MNVTVVINTKPAAPPQPPKDIPMNPPVTFTLDMTLDGARTLTVYKDVPKAEFHQAERKFHAIRGECIGWTTDTLSGLPLTFTGPLTGNFSVSYVADGGSNWGDAASQNGIPQDAADYVVSMFRAALAPLAKYIAP